MNENTVVVVFPSLFSLNKMDYLVSSISTILKLKKLSFSKIRRNGSVIIVETDDPVFASSAIGSLFGIEKIAIAKETKNSFNVIVSAITTVGTNLLLRGERFYVKVEGTGKEYVPKDIELAATSSLIEKTVDFQTKPGTESDHDKIIYTYITKSHAYVCIFIDKCWGGVPYQSQNEKALCGIYDEISVISCLQTLKMGFDVKILVCYTNELELLRMVKMINQVLPKLLQTKIELHFCRLDIKSSGGSILFKIAIITEILVSLAKETKMDRISLAISPLIFPAWFIEYNAKSVFQKGVIPWFPLSGIDNSIFETANEIGLGKYMSKIESLCKTRFKKDLSKDKVSRVSQNSFLGLKTITITPGPKNIHEIIDSLKSNH
ncbi:MAG TPA: thiamine biosynthesis protein [Nitrosopumilaceae archaeon]|nr:thiamine biosynthesis protein [Nitrosopumilaceae archaeon]